MVLRPLTAELDSKDSPIRRFLDDRFTSGLRDVQRRYRQAAPPLVVPSADRQEANPGTVGTAADWLLRFMLHPRPSLALAATGAALCGRRSGVVEAFIEIAESLGQLAAFREVFASTLLPQLARCPGRWILGPEFTGSTLLKADADLIAAGLLLDLKTDSRFSLGVTVLFQVIGYALLDFIRTVTCSSPSVLRSSYAPTPPGTGHVPAVCRIEIAHRERTSEMPNVNVTYAEMQSAARQLQAGEQTIEGDLSKLKRLVDNLVAAGYVTDASSRQFEASYTQFNTGATKMVQGLKGMGQYLDAAVKAFHETDTQLAASLKQ